MFALVGSRVLPVLDRPFRDRRRSVTSLGTDFPLCYLTTTGRKTGKPRTAALLYVADGDRVVVIASNFGRRDHPSWSLNLLAAPDAMLTVDGVARPVRARLATDAERERIWPEALRIWPGYEGYRRRAGREIRVFVLESRLGTAEVDEVVALCEHDPSWAARYATEAGRIGARLGSSARLEHIGSTAVPGLIAKPIIDVMVGVVPSDEQAVADAFRELGYESGGGPVDRHYLRRREAGSQFNAQLVELDGALWNGNLALREHLRHDPDAAARYAEAKRAAATAAPRLLAYSRLKAPTIEELLREAGSP